MLLEYRVIERLTYGSKVQATTLPVRWAQLGQRNLIGQTLSEGTRQRAPTLLTVFCINVLIDQV